MSNELSEDVLGGSSSMSAPAGGSGRSNTTGAVISLTSVVGVIVAYVALANAGTLSFLDDFIYYEYTVPQLVMLTLIVVGLAVLAFQVYIGVVPVSDLLSDTSQYFQQALGMGQKETQRFLKDVAHQAAPGVFAISAEGNNYPSPQDVYRQIQARFVALQNNVVAMVGAVASGIVQVIPGRLPAPPPKNAVTKKSMTKIIAVFVFAAVAFFALFAVQYLLK